MFFVDFKKTFIHMVLSWNKLKSNQIKVNKKLFFMDKI